MAVQLHRVVAIRRASGSKTAITKIRVQESNGDFADWTTSNAIQAMQAGTDEFFVVGIVWSPVGPWPPKNPRALRTETDWKLADDLQYLPTF